MRFFRFLNGSDSTVDYYLSRPIAILVGKALGNEAAQRTSPQPDPLQAP